ncbi:hypothetical protein ABZX77_02695 [Streptomyces sp. NPDC004237]|uniref:hypothetical protein n=1 Tax=Streptomyces sp. NPDC004237 TaxID=3154455 RepID=UPI0033B3D5D8
MTKELGVKTESLRKWVRAGEAVPSGGGGAPATPSEREELEKETLMIYDPPPNILEV